MDLLKFNIDTDEIDHFYSLARKRLISEKEIILHEGQICNTLAYVKSGISRHFILTKNGDDITKNIVVPKQFIFFSTFSYILHIPSRVQFQTLTPCEIWEWDKKHFDTFQEGENCHLLYQSVIENMILRKEEKEISNMEDNARERYLKFFETKAFLFNEIPHHYIASYLSMTPETLSRIRKSNS